MRAASAGNRELGIFSRDQRSGYGGDTDTEQCNLAANSAVDGGNHFLFGEVNHADTLSNDDNQNLNHNTDKIPSIGIVWNGYS
jgi:hypothetical protein